MKSISNSLLICSLITAFNYAHARVVPIDTTNSYFSTTAATSIVKATQADCQLIDQSGIGRAVWVQVTFNGYQYNECIRYYQYGLLDNATNNRAIAYFSGDVQGANGIVSASYAQQSPIDKQNEAILWSNKLNNRPYIYIARPGIYGSSGVANGARKPLESLLMSEALNKIKTRHQILNYVLVGHSSGGHVVASLLSKRRDILCAVPSSAPASPEIRAQSRQAAAPIREFEAIDALNASVPRHAALRVFVVGDKNDKTVPWAAQHALHDKLNTLGWPSEIFNFQAKDSASHDVATQARLVAGMCADGRPTAYIQNAVLGTQFR